MNENVYSLPVACLNCDWVGSLTLTKGEEFNTIKIKFGSDNNCPHCGCATLTKRHLPKWNSDNYFMRKLGDDSLLFMVGDYKKDKELAGVINE